MGVKKANRLTNLEVNEITLCKSPAVSSAKFLILKSTKTSKSDKATWQRTVVFKAFDDEKQIAYGYALVPGEEDSQGDIISESDIEKTAHSFLEILSKGEQQGQGVGHEHESFNNIGHPVESAIDRGGSIAKSFSVPDDQIRSGGWWVGIRMEDEYWDLTKSGEITGFSIGGTGEREIIEEASKSSESGALGSVVDFIAKLCSGKTRRPRKLGKATSYVELAKAMSYEEIITIQMVREALIEKTWALLDAFWSIMDDDEVANKVTKVEESVSQYLEDIRSLTKVEKNLITQSSKGEDEMTSEQLEKLTGTVEVLTKSVDVLTQKLIKTDDPPKKEDPPKSDPSKGDDPPKSDPPVAKTGDPPEKGDQVGELSDKVDKLAELVKTIANVPTDRKGDDGANGDRDSKAPVHKKIKDGGLVGTALSFRMEAEG